MESGSKTKRKSSACKYLFNLKQKENLEPTVILVQVLAQTAQDCPQVAGTDVATPMLVKHLAWSEKEVRCSHAHACQTPCVE